MLFSCGPYFAVYSAKDIYNRYHRLSIILQKETAIMEREPLNFALLAVGLVHSLHFCSRFRQCLLKCCLLSSVLVRGFFIIAPN